MDKFFKKTKVSVLMPTFNNAPFLKDSIESILSQTFKDFEFIIINDGSTDYTQDLLDEYAKKDKRIQVINNKKNMGIVFSLNRGLQECSGEYILRMDSDDIATNDRVEKQVGFMDTHADISALGAALSYIDAQGNELKAIRYCGCGLKSRLIQTPLMHPTVIMKKETLVRNRFFYEEKYRYAEDYFLWLQLSKVSKIYAINDVVLKYRLNKQATKVQQLKATIWATLRVKKDAIFVLKIKPTLTDIIMIFIESILLLLPSSLILFLYFKINFGKSIKINL